MRRPFIPEPKSLLAVWSGRLAVFALLVALLSILILRSGMLEAVPALATFAAALICAALAVLLALASFVPIWRHGRSGLGRAILGMLLGLALLAYPAYLGHRAQKLPAINDITTDFERPPQFDLLARLRPRGTSDYPARFAALQRQAYPDIAPLQEDDAPDAAYRAALDVITKRKWLIVEARAPTPRRPDGVIEAVSRTLIMGFRDDVVVRITRNEDGSRIDVRSASRIGTHDFGANAARVRALLADLDDAMGEEPDRPAEPEKPTKGEKKKAPPKHAPAKKSPKK